MKIDSTYTKSPAADKVQAKPVSSRTAETVPATQQKTGNAAFKVDISTSAEQLLKAAPSEEQIRRDKVEAIRNQLASGSYNISGKDVAAKILNALKN